jgi:predicted metal-dependent HD superfamily phosphohydrolase
VNPLHHSWQRAWTHLALPEPHGLRDALINAYSEPHRHYHTLQHLHECIAHLAPAIHLAQQAGEVEVALWFHDAIYGLQAKDNEARSAQWASEALTASGASHEQVTRVHALIMATCHMAKPVDAEGVCASGADQQLLVDIDLSILGASPARFAEYDQQVRAEYRWVPSLIYRVKRKAVLKSFLDRDTIYATKHFQALHEQQARVNLQHAVHGASTG